MTDWGSTEYAIDKVWVKGGILNTRVNDKSRMLGQVVGCTLRPGFGPASEMGLVFTTEDSSGERGGVYSWAAKSLKQAWCSPVELKDKNLTVAQWIDVLLELCPKSEQSAAVPTAGVQGLALSTPPPAKPAPPQAKPAEDSKAAPPAKPAEEKKATSEPEPAPATRPTDTDRRAEPERETERAVQEEGGEMEEGSICPGCKEEFKWGDSTATGLGKKWHVHCFVCAGTCGAELGGKEFLKKNGEAFCTQCFQVRFSDRCAGCEEPLAAHEKRWEALGQFWHKDCFRCSLCKQAVGGTGSKFCVRENRPVCEACMHLNPILVEADDADD